MKPDKIDKKELERHLQTVKEFYGLFKNAEDLRKELWPVIYATLGSDEFAEMEPHVRQNIFETFDLILNFTTAVYQLLKHDIKE